MKQVEDRKKQSPKTEVTTTENKKHPVKKQIETRIAKRKKGRSAEIFSVFVKHKFYANGFTPKELRTTLEDLGPTYVKIGQIMSSRSDMLPLDYCLELEKLRSTVKPLDAAIARQVIEEETGKKIEDIYSEFTDKPIGSASIAQAHKAVLKDGTKVVTKVQRPKIAEMMRRDFVLLKKFASLVNVATEDLDAGIVDLKSVIEELEIVTEDELNFKVEAENTKKFRENCITDDSVISCPTIIDELTTERILTMTFVDGYSISKRDRVIEEGYDCDEIGKVIIENYMHQVLDVGTFHGDPHQGNIMISHGVPYWIDFGMIGHISDRGINTIQDIIFALLQKDVESLTNAALSFGKAKKEINKAKLMDDIEVLIDKYMSAKKLTDIDIAGLMTDLTTLMTKHSIEMPGEYTMLVRSLVTIEGVIESFCPDLNIFTFLTDKMIERAKENLDLKEKITEILQKLGTAGLQTVKIPSLAFGILRNLAKGRLKLNFELAGYDEIFKNLNTTIKYVFLAIFSCALFAGGCTLCTTNIQPQLNGMPILALVAFVFSIGLAIFTIIKMTGNSKK